MPWTTLAGIALLSVGLAGVALTLLVGPDPARVRAMSNLSRGIAAEPEAPASPKRRRKSGLSHQIASKVRTRGLERLLIRAGRPMAWPIDRVVSVKFVLTAVGVVLATLLVLKAPSLRTLILGVGILAFLFFLPELLLYNIGVKRREAVQLELADTLDQMSIAVEAGLGFDAAMVRVARNGKGVLANELVRTLQDIQVGQSRRDAYEALAERTNVAELQRFIRSIVQAETYGLALATVLHTQAAEMRVTRRQRAEEKAMKIPVKVIFPLILFIMPALFIVVIGPAAINIIEAFSGAG